LLTLGASQEAVGGKIKSNALLALSGFDPRYVLAWDAAGCAGDGPQTAIWKLANLWLEGHSWREITEETGISQGTAQRTVSSPPKEHMNRARRRFSSQLLHSTTVI
jgi:hypothetical protein